ncbi:MAG: hypothetical protein MI864_26950 [Pseudomonadales bacterium]|nr:hypothetical protein [Pseudomonadales bacterium]
MGDVFKKEGFVSSPTEERARFLYAISQELTQTLMEIDGVITARVHVALPEKALLSENQGSASVSVVVIQSPNANLSNYETDIKAIITDGVEGLDDVNKVTVKFFTRNESFNYIPAENGDLSGQGTFTLQASVFGFVLGTGFILAFGYFRRRRQPDAAVPELKPEL